MKNTFKKIAALAAAVLMTVALAVPVLAQDVTGSSADNATITVTNAAKGETYSIYKLFDATVTGTTDGSIAYQGDIPTSLSAYFKEDTAGNITATEAAGTTEVSTALAAALKTWASSATATASIESDGSTLNFKGLDYGYYVVTTTQGETAITVDSTNPNATVNDKNTTVPVGNLTKTVGEDDKYYIGETVNYTVSFTTSNYAGTKQIVSYVIKDTMPASMVPTVDSIKVMVLDDDGKEVTSETKDVTAQFSDKDADGVRTITITWASNGTNLYDNGATIELKYHATVTADAVIDGAGNTNTVTVEPKDKDGKIPDGDDGKPSSSSTTETIYTYAAAIQKVNDKGEALSGATFSVPYDLTLTTEGSATAAAVYTVTGKTIPEGETEANTTEVTTPASGVVIIKGVDENAFSVTETAAPNGYNKLTSAISVSPQMTGATTTASKTYLDEDGNVTDTETSTVVSYTNNDISTSVAVVVNKTGAELPSTGGIGTTIFYIVGGCLVVAAVIVLVVKKRRAE